MRQRGTRFHPGDGVGMVRTAHGACRRASARAFAPRPNRALRAVALQGKDHTIFATIVGNVRFKRDSHRSRTSISVEEEAQLQKQAVVVSATA